MPNLTHSAGLLVLVSALGCSNSTEKAPPKSPPTGKGPTGMPVVMGEPDTSVETALPPLPRLPRVAATITGDGVSISIEPVDGARDYRVYALPADADVLPGSDGHVTVRNATYRCGGDRQSPPLATEEDPPRGQAVTSVLTGFDVSGYRRSAEEVTLGYVYQAPGEGRIPVYALGRSRPDSDNHSCFNERWQESRTKDYVASEEQRAQLLTQRYRDDGVVFYVPAAAGAGTKPVYAARGQGVSANEMQLYYVDGPEADLRGRDTTAFNVLTEQAAGSVPLMRVTYTAGCGGEHDELAAGNARFQRARSQGDQSPMFDLHWSGLTAETTLVVEALDVGCPYSGVLAAESRPAGNEDGIDYPPFVTLDELRAASETGEIFINGQHEASNRPRPIARSFVKVAPVPPPAMDWYTGFGPNDPVPDFAGLGWNAPCEDPAGCIGQFRQTSDFADIHLYGATANRTTIGVVLGELWVTYADVGADVGGKFRLTPNVKGRMAADSYLHVTMEVDAFTTARRYPQILVSDANPPVQLNLPTSNTVILETFTDRYTGNWPNIFHVEVCDNRYWDVNDHCPTTDTYRIYDTDNTTIIGLSPGPEVAEHSGVDRSTRFDAFLSTRRAYLFLDGQPHACINLPASGVPVGEVTVTFGDVLYHSGADQLFTFHENRQKQYAKRHFDNIGFKSGVEGPAWDDNRFPCTAWGAGF